MNKTKFPSSSNSQNLPAFEIQRNEHALATIFSGDSPRNVEHSTENSIPIKSLIENEGFGPNVNINNRDVSTTASSSNSAFKLEAVHSQQEQLVYKPLTYAERQRKHKERMDRLAQKHKEIMSEITEKGDALVSATRAMVNESERALESLYDTVEQNMEQSRLQAHTVIDELAKFNQSLEEVQQRIHETSEEVQMQELSDELKQNISIP